MFARIFSGVSCAGDIDGNLKILPLEEFTETVYMNPSMVTCHGSHPLKIDLYIFRKICTLKSFIRITLRFQLDRAGLIKSTFVT